MSGILTLAATPIGNLLDASPRLVEALSKHLYIAAEDKRNIIKLMHNLKIQFSGNLISYHQYNEQKDLKKIISLLKAGSDVLLVSDAGMPVISDPGFPLVREAIKQEILITIIPGPSAVISALALSGLPVNSFTFEGFIPKKDNERHMFFVKLAKEVRTMVFFESPHRINKTLLKLSEIFGHKRKIALVREITKKFEEVRRGTCQDILVSLKSNPVKGEIVLVIEGYILDKPSISEALISVKQLINNGEFLKNACKTVSLETGISIKKLYNNTIK